MSQPADDGLEAIVAGMLEAQGFHPDPTELAAATDAYRFLRTQVDRLYDVPGLGDDPPAGLPGPETRSP
jgi:hypothetical protein